NWLVPDGYISDDEGLGEREPTDKKKIELVDDVVAPRPKKRKYVEKQPIIIGPFLCNDLNPSVPVENHRIDPFDALLNPAGPEASDLNDRPIATGSPLSIASLFDLFIAARGRVAKRQFELKLNQIATKMKVDGKAMWNIRPDVELMEGTPSKAAPGYVEFKLRSTSSTNFVHNVMTLSGPPVDMADFTTPVRLVRDPNTRDDGDGMGPGSEGDDRFIGKKKRKTRIIQPEDEDEQSLRSQERAPWLLEDFDGQHSYVSQLMSPDAKYVIFVNQGNEFRVLLASKWYRFAPKLAYRPLSLEEAEERMAGKGRNEDFDRWLMKKRPPGSSQQASGEASGVASVVASKGPKVATRMVNLGEEGFDFEEFVDDDDGEDLYHRGADEDDPSMPRIDRSRQAKNLTDAGKQVKRLFKNLDRPNYFYESDDEAADPYAEETEPSDEEPPPPAKRPEPAIAIQQPKSSSLRAPAPVLSASQSHASTPPGSQSASLSVSRLPDSQNASPGGSRPPGSQDPSQSNSQRSPGLLTEAEIVAILRESPMRTKELISRVKGKLREDPQNKEIFKEVVKKVATVRSTTSQDDDKLLELKPEYR
ncbi:Transcription factor TFIIF complex alpha subunit Tfg1, partial [Paramicrosporidium saccamoebae]